MCNDYRLEVETSKIFEDFADLKIKIRFSEGTISALRQAEDYFAASSSRLSAALSRWGWLAFSFVRAKAERSSASGFNRAVTFGPPLDRNSSRSSWLGWPSVSR